MELDRVIAVGNDKTIYRDGDKCIKMFNSRYTKAQVLNEALNQTIIEETGISVPKILEVTVINDKWAIVMEFIEGKLLSELIEENPDKKEEYLELFLNLQVDVHSKNAPLLKKSKDRISQHIAESDLDATTRYHLCSMVEEMPKHSKVCHGDFVPSNIIVKEDGSAYIIDWPHASRGNSSADAAQTYLSFMFNPGTFDAETYLKAFCEKSGIPEVTVRKWIPIIAASKTIKAYEREKEALMNIGESKF